MADFVHEPHWVSEAAGESSFGMEGRGDRPAGGHGMDVGRARTRPYPSTCRFPPVPGEQQELLLEGNSLHKLDRVLH